ncbi:hypothetical protein J3D60_001357 [Pseudomonas sp. S3E17]|nr:hypothetical protein [Pseudomonas sp. S3E17]
MDACMGSLIDRNKQPLLPFKASLQSAQMTTDHHFMGEPYR